jgi:O-methyltransferase
MLGSHRFLALKAHAATFLRRYPALFAAASTLFYKLDRSFATLSPGAPAAIDDAIGRLSRDGPPGDYYEFGVFRGFTLLAAQQSAQARGLGQMRFHGFDSFQGLPAVDGIDSTGARFFEGQFACSKNVVVRNLKRHGADLSRVTLTEGFFCDSLTDELKAQPGFRSAAIAFIDCDLYSSTCDVLNWLESLLQDGSLVLCDDWYSFGDSAELGQQKAFAEFLERSGVWKAEPIGEFELHGKAFRLRRAAA